MKEENLESLFQNLAGSFDMLEPKKGHQQRFSAKLKKDEGLVVNLPKWYNQWKPMAIAASVAVLCLLGVQVFFNAPSIEEQVAAISPEISNTELYFASLIEEQIKELENESSPETSQMIEDTLLQLKKLETNYLSLEQDLLDGGNSKLILSAMITNFQTRIDLLEEVMQKIESIKNLKQVENANYSI